MKYILLLAIGISLSCAATAQSQKINMTSTSGSMLSPKSNASLLQETHKNTQTTNKSTEEEDLAEKYKTDGTNTSGTYRSVLQTKPSYNSPDAQPAMMNATNHQYNLGNTTGQSTIYTDNQGKIRGANTTFKLGGNK